jgi:hypothetical protein
VVKSHNVCSRWSSLTFLRLRTARFLENYRGHRNSLPVGVFSFLQSAGMRGIGRDDSGPYLALPRYFTGRSGALPRANYVGLCPKADMRLVTQARRVCAQPGI